MEAGGGNDTDMSDANPTHQPPQQPPPPGIDNIPATLSHGGRFIQYNIFGNIFEVTAKYKPPIMPIGKGAYGIVCSALNSETGEHVAIKKIANAFDNKIDAKRTLREIKLLRHMDHENVVAIRDIIPPPQRGVFNDVYIAYELMDTDLHQIIRSNQALSEEHCQVQEFAPQPILCMTPTSCKLAHCLLGCYRFVLDNLGCTTTWVSQ